MIDFASLYVFFLFSIAQHPVLYIEFLMLFHERQRWVSWLNFFLMYLVFGDFSLYSKSWLTCFVITGRPGELSYNFSVSYELYIL